MPTVTDVWIQTRTGRAFPLLTPRRNDIDIEDIAPALAKICRYNGHCRGFYSVAQHSVLVATVLKRHGQPREIIRAGLFHDAAEAYVGDMVRPLKHLMVRFGEIERRIEFAIAERFDIPIPMPESVKRADNALLATEARDLMGPPPMPWDLPEPPVDWIQIVSWPPDMADRKFREFADEVLG